MGCGGKSCPPTSTLLSYSKRGVTGKWLACQRLQFQLPGSKLYPWTRFPQLDLRGNDEGSWSEASKGWLCLLQTTSAPSARWCSTTGTGLLEQRQTAVAGQHLRRPQAANLRRGFGGGRTVSTVGGGEFPPPHSETEETLLWGEKKNLIKTTVSVRKKRWGCKKYHLYCVIFLTGISVTKYVLWLYV